MKFFVTIVLLCWQMAGLAQTDEVKLTSTLKEFHQALVNKNKVSINQQTDKALSYGHSNGWVETKKELIEHLESGYMEYNSFREDSIKVEVNGNVAHARFIAEINATMGGKEFTFQLRVLEVWVKKGKRWVLFARQAVRK
ncbi:MAG TPA: nuclear transport factor 2 family protein [Chitinophagaceae bacterium]|nr:nuclear transport factor 2 family protein [Chitinophagaceae bacterium]HPH32973.1 nuclear transport factor 2 family protein [Chitinophagaceae bacterium]HPN60182.1 nuclear transport factor 2 family protein [Chitinophagaceae bacterium]